MQYVAGGADRHHRIARWIAANRIGEEQASTHQADANQTDQQCCPDPATIAPERPPKTERECEYQHSGDEEVNALHQPDSLSESELTGCHSGL